MIGAATTAVYSYMRWVQLWQGGGVQNSLAHHWFLQSRQWALLYTAFSGAFALGLFWSLFSLGQMIWFFPPIVIAALYPIGFPRPFQAFSSLRAAPGLKLFLIAASWVYLTYFIPILLQNVWLDTYVLLEAVARLIFVMAITLPFDVRDLRADRVEMKTIPQQYGADFALDLAKFGVVITQLWMVLRIFILDQTLLRSVAWLIALELAYWIIHQVHRHRHDLFVSFYVEAIPIILGICLLLAEALPAIFTFAL